LIPFLLKQSLFHFFLAFFYKVKKDNWFLKRNENGTPFLFAFAFSVLFGLKSFSKNEFFEFIITDEFLLCKNYKSVF